MASPSAALVLVAITAVASAELNSLGLESPKPPDAFLHELHGRVLAEHDDSTVPRNETMARVLQTTCYRVGWKYGNGDFSCAPGYRMPLVNEFNLVAPCIAASDYGRFSYYNDIAVQGTSPPAPGPNVIMSWITSAAVQYSCNAGHYETSTYQGYAPTWTCGLTWSGAAQPVCVRCPLGSYCFGGNKWTCPAGRFGGSTGLTSSSCSGICAEGFWCTAGSATATQNQCGGTGSFYCPAGSSRALVAPYGTYTGPLTAPVTQRSWYLPCPPGRSCENGLITPLVDFSTVCSTPLPALLTEAVAGVDFGPRIVPTTPGCPSCTVGYGLAVSTADPTCNASAVAVALVVNTTTGRLRTTSPSILFAKCPGGFGVDVMAVRREATVPFVTPTPGCSAAATQPFSRDWVMNGNLEAGTLYWDVVRGNINVKGPGGCCFKDWTCPGGLASRSCFDINGEAPGTIQQTLRGLPGNSRFNFTMNVNGNWNGASQSMHTVDIFFNGVRACSISFTRPPSWTPGTVYKTSQQRWCLLNTTTGGDVVLKIVSTSLTSPVAGMVIDDIQVEGPLAAQPCAVCRVNVAVAQVPRQPVITSCTSSGVTERADIGTPVAANLTAVNLNSGTTLVWSINGTSPFSISGCDGRLTVDRFISYGDQTVFHVPVVVTNFGLTPSLSASCNLTVPVRQLRLPPSFSTTTFRIPEDSENGTVVGNVGAFAQADGSAVNRVWFAVNDSRHCFEIDAYGNITLVRPLPAMIVQSSFTYVVSASTTAGMVGTATITIVLATVPQRPTTYPQFRTISEAAAPGFVLGAPLAASHPQSVPINFTSLVDPAGGAIPFVIDDDGNVAYQPNANTTLDFTRRKVYALEFEVTDALGLTVTSTLTITLTQINKPPQWLSNGFFQVQMDEYAVGGTQVHVLVSSGDTPLKMPVFVSAYNLQETLGMVYAIVSVQPPQAAAFFAMDGLSGAITLSYNAPGPFRYEPIWSYTRGNAIMVNVSATNTGLPPLTSYGLVEVNVSAIRPRIQPATFVIPGAFTSGQRLGRLSAWTFVPGAPLNYTLVSNDVDAAGRPAFVLDRSTGNLSLAAGVAFDFNTKSAFQLLVCVTDASGLNATAPVAVTLQHVNRPPEWRPVPRLFARALTAGDIGPALLAYVTDPDVSLGIGETLVFRFADTAPSNGNTDNTFAITNVTGQIFASNLTAAAFQYPAQATVAPTFNITVVVQDAGIDGAAFAVATNVTIELTANRIAPAVSYANLTVPELSPPGTAVGMVVGTTVNAGYRLTYALAPAGANAYKPFPFSITTIDDGIANAGRVVTTNASVLENGRYQATVTVTDNNPTSPLSASAPVDIYVTWVPRSPYFNTATRQPASVRFEFTADEHAAAGVSVASDGISASSKDAWLQASLRYSLTGAADGLLVINATTGAVTTGAGWAAIDFATIKDVNATVVATDSLGLSDTATLRVRVLEINKPAVFNAPMNAANVTVAALAVSEDASVGTHIGYVTAADPNERALWSTKRYAVAAAGASSFFGIHPDTGALYVAAPGMNWWDQPSVNVTVTVQDSDPFAPIVVSTTVTVNLIQVNTVSIDRFFVDAAAGMFAAANISATVSNVLQAEFTTNGTAGERLVYVSGNGFGRTARRLAAEGMTVADTNVTMTFGGGQYTADCVVVQANTLLACAVPEGAGAMHRWTVTIDGRWTATSTMMTRYMAPVIAGVTKAGVSTSAPWDEHAVSTAGTDTLLVTGSNLGPAGTAVFLAYGRESLPGFESNFGAAAACVTVTPQTTVACPAVPGIGAELKFAVQVAQQASAVFLYSPVHYSPPTITSVVAPTLSTLGGTLIVINGTDLPAARIDDGSIVLEYGLDLAAGSSATYRATCAVSVPLVQITCEAAPGVGVELDLRVGVAGQWSLPVVGVLSYARPVVTGVGGAGRLNAATTGGQDLVITGSSFGPASPLFPNGTAIPSDMLPSVLLVDRNGNQTQDRVFEARGCYVISDSSLACLTPPGAGKGLQLVVAIGGAASLPSTNATVTYSAPVVSGYEAESRDASITALATRGNEVIIVKGAGFGPEPEGLEQVVYSTDDNQQSFIANCTWLSDAALRCITTPGAGTGLRWYVRVAGQSSVNPSVSYAQPIIDGFGGTTTDAAVEGGDRVILYGRHLGLAAHLGAVTFGPSGTEFTAACAVLVPHSQLNCTLPPGIGRNLRWQVTVGRQTSKLSTATTSYSMPLLTKITPASLPTSARSAAGDIYLTIHGVDLAFRSLTLPLTVRVSTANIAPPPQYILDYHWANIAVGGPGNSVVLAFLSQCTVVVPVSISAAPAPGSDVAELVRNNKPRKMHSVTFKAPEGVGQNAAVFVMAGSTVMSNILFIEYQAPKITSVAAERKAVPNGYYRITIEGTSFCNGQNGCGIVMVNGVMLTPVSWSHTMVEVIAAMKSGTETDGSVVIIAGGRSSNIVIFERPAPGVSNLASQGAWTGMSTRGGELFYVRGVYDVDATVNNSVTITIGGRLCTDQWGYIDNGANDTASASFTLVCRTPAGVGQALPIGIMFRNATSRTDALPVFSYGAPRLDDVTILAPVVDAASATAVANLTTLQALLPGGNAFVGGASAAGGIPTLGATVRIIGVNLGDDSISTGSLEDPVGMAILPVLGARHDVAVAVIPPGDGTTHALRYSVGGQISQMLAFRYAPPTVTSIQPNHGPAAGGTVLTIVGANLGVSRPVITIGGQPCPVVEPFAPHPTHSAVTCVVPRGAGANVPIQLTVGDQSTTPANLRWTYDAPLVSSISPANGPTSGVWPGPAGPDGVPTTGARIVQVAAGKNFGTSGTIAFVPTGRGDVSSTNQTIPGVDVLSWNDTAIVFYMPAGYGDRLGVQVTTAGQRSALGVEFSYDAPSITAITRIDRSAAQCQPVEECFQYGNTSMCRAVSGGCYDTRGGYVLQVIGLSFWPANTAVTIGGRPCTRPVEAGLLALMSTNLLMCRVPAHTGENLPVIATVGAARTSQVTNATRFSYDAPSVSVISPNMVSATGGDVATIRGKGFGTAPTPLTITIDGVPCTASSWVSDSILRCTLPPGTVGGKNVTIQVANRAQPLVLYDIQEQLKYTCPSGYYGRQGQQCKTCKRGASCPGGDVDISQIPASKGFWKMSSAAAAPPSGARQLSTTDDDEAFVPCRPEAACLPGNECLDGYTGDRCSQCIPGAYYRAGEYCRPCPNNMKATMAAIFAVLALTIAVARLLDRAGVVLASSAVIVDFAQVISATGLTELTWVPAMATLLRALSAFSLSLDLTAPECVNPSLKWHQKFFIIQVIPFVVLAALAAVYLLRFVYRLACLPATAAKRRRLPSIHPSVGAFIGFMRVYYLYSAKTSFDAINCTTVGDAAYMNGLVQPEYECGAPGSQQKVLFWLGVGTLVFYGGALPGAAMFALWRARALVQRDQLLRLQDEPKPATGDFRRAWGKLYGRYMPAKWWWEACITLRKLFVASAVAMASRQTPAYQMAALLVTFAISYALHIVHWPLLVPARRDEALAELGASAAPQKQRRVVSLLARIADLNIVEAVQIACCGVVALAGMVLDSQRFQDANMEVPDVRREYNAWAFGSLACICGALAYGVFAFVVETATSVELRRAICSCSSGNRAQAPSKPRAVVAKSVPDQSIGVVLGSGDVSVTMASPLSRDDSGVEDANTADGFTPTGMQKRTSFHDRHKSSDRRIPAEMPPNRLNSRHVPVPPKPAGARSQEPMPVSPQSSSTGAVPTPPQQRRLMSAVRSSPAAASTRRVVVTGSAVAAAPSSPGSTGTLSSTGFSVRSIGRVAPGTTEASIVAGYKPRALYGGHHAPIQPAAAAADSAESEDARA